MLLNMLKDIAYPLLKYPRICFSVTMQTAHKIVTRKCNCLRTMTSHTAALFSLFNYLVVLLLL